MRGHDTQVRLDPIVKLFEHVRLNVCLSYMTSVCRKEIL